jgi:hypothetical protein
MRTKEISHAVIDLLELGKADKAFKLFSRECDPSPICDKSDNDRTDVMR